MNILLKTVATLVSTGAVISLTVSDFQKQQVTTDSPTSSVSHQSLRKASPGATPKIQAAILLDVSNSMDGLIEQAKAQLWNMVSVMGRAKCGTGETPQIETALYEYGSPRNSAQGGFVKQLSAFSSDLDSLSKTLFALTTNGGDEYCGQVIFSSINDLAWDTAAGSYKVIFIAGNEDFLQGSLHYTKACQQAAAKGILVNTIYCGDRMQGIREHWNLGAECGGGSFSNINQDAKQEEIPTPYDSSLMVLNDRLNSTYIGYGSQAVNGYAKMAFADVAYQQTNKSAALKRVTVKGNKRLYNNSGWDLVDAAAEKEGDAFFDKLDVNLLPDSLKTKSRTELKKVVKAKSEERTAVQNQIAQLSVQREAYLTEQRKKRASGDNQQTLESETEKLIKLQAKKYKMVIE